MQKTPFAAALAALALLSSAATAADMTPYGAPARAYSWQGAYVGANVGYQWASVGNSSADPSGVAGGFQAGYNWQYNQFVIGAETDLQLSDADDRFAAWKFSNPWFGTLRARGGMALNNILFYGTVGLAYGTLRAETAGIGESRTNIGWAGGAGMEVALMSNWTARAEYLYVDIGERGFVLDGGAQHGIQSNLLRFGVNYRF